MHKFTMNNKAFYTLVTSILILTFILSGCGQKPTNENETGSEGQNNTVNPPTSNDSNTNDSNTNDASPSDSTNPIVTIEMENGDIIKVELYPEVAPNTVNSFISLTEAAFYDGVIFHRVIPGFMIQGGDPDGNGTGGPGYAIKGEFTANGFENNLKHEKGVISMGRGGNPYYDSAGSQFFIVHQDSPHLDTQYAAFGKVIEGIEVVDQIAEVETTGSAQSPRPVEDQKMKKVTVETFGVDYPEPEVIK